MEYFFIETQVELNELCNKMQNEKIIAIDTEFVRRTTFYPIICLIQVCFNEESAYVIDMMQELDIKNLMDIIYKEDVIKIFHSSYQDLEILYNINKKLPKNIFDTQIALMAIGQAENISYDKMLKILLKTYIDKSNKDSSWVERPLKKSQIIYAANDVFYLRKCYLVLHGMLLKENRYIFLEKKLQDLSNEERYVFNIEDMLNKLATQNNNKYLTNLKNLILFRYNKATQLNLTNNRIIDDSQIEELAKIIDVKKEAIDAILHIKQRDKYSNEIATLLQKNQEEINITKWSNVKDINKDIIKIIEIILKKIAKTLKIHHSLIASKNDLEDLVINKENAKNSCMNGIRHEIFGKIAIQILNGEKAILIKNNEIDF